MEDKKLSIKEIKESLLQSGRLTPYEMASLIISDDEQKAYQIIYDIAKRHIEELFTDSFKEELKEQYENHIMYGR